MSTKKIFFLLLILFALSSISFSGTVETGIPPFKIMLSNGKIYTAGNLPKEKPVVLIYFSPDCGHCQNLMTDFFKKTDQFKKAEVVMITFKPLDEVKNFEHSYPTSKYPNIIVGSEVETFYLRMYYKLAHIPFTALFNKHGNLIYSYRDETSIDDLIKRLKKLSN